MEKKKSGCGCFLAIILIILIMFIIFIIGLYTINPVKLEKSLEDINTQLSNLVLDINGVPVIDENIELPEKEELTDAQRYYYYQQLSDTAKKIYVTIEKNVDKLKNGEENISLPASLNDVAKSNSNGKELIAEEFQNAWDAFITDKSQYFYLDSSKVCLVTKTTTRGSSTNYEFFIGKGNNSTYFTDDFKTKEDVELAEKSIEKAKNEILKNATGNNYEKILYVHNWIVDNVEYDTKKGENTSNIYGALLNKTAICEGYARAFKYMLDELNIPCILVAGTAVDENGNTERHAWNYVYIKNNWYAIDTTWDDPIIIGNGKVTDTIKYKYFLKGKNTMQKDHKTIGQITQNGFDFKYPELAQDDIK